MDKKISYSALLAFSLVELMISLITVSLIAAAFAPVITKKLSNGTITVGSFGGNGTTETNVAPQSQKDCNSVGAQLVYVETDETQHTGICVTQYNIGDGNFSIPTGSIDENILAGDKRTTNYCDDKKCCWHGKTTNPDYCDSKNGSYSGCNRTACNYEAAKNICENLSYGGYSNWRLPSKDELDKINPEEYSNIGSSHSGDSGLMLCANAKSSTSASRCGSYVNCYGNSYPTRPNVCYVGGIFADSTEGENAYELFSDDGSAVRQYVTKLLPHGVRCVLGAITVKTVSETSCPSGSYLNSDNACISCTTIDPNCTSCTGGVCMTCSNNYTLDKSGKCEDPNKKQCTLTFTSAGDKQFKIPEDVSDMEVTLVSGGNGGSGGDGTVMTHTFVTTGTGNSANNETNLLSILNNGRTTYTTPDFLKDKYALISSCGGGGGGAEKKGGNGEYSEKAVLRFTKESYNIYIGGYGGGKNTAGGKAGGGSGKGTTTAGEIIITASGKKGGSGGKGTDGNGASGAYYGGGGSSGHVIGTGHGGGGGGATMFYNDSNVYHVTSGGGGGGGAITGYWAGGAGGGGGGPRGGKGGTGHSDNGNSSAGGTPTGGQTGDTTVFGSNYCSGGGGNSNGKPGAMLITYIGNPTGAKGGGAGAIVPMQTVDLYNNDNISAGETLKIHIGTGGVGGAGAHISDDGTIVADGSIGASGEESYISNISNVKILATKGIQRGSTAGYITNGKNSSQIVVENFSSSDGSTNNEKDGGNGGATVLNSEEFIGGTGGVNVSNGQDAPDGNYGAGGGGGYGTMDGGSGADGYAKIKFMTSSANCTSVKTQLAYNEFNKTKENFYTKIKIAFIQFKNFLLALFNNAGKDKTCMK